MTTEPAFYLIYQIEENPWSGSVPTPTVLGPFLGMRQVEAFRAVLSDYVTIMTDDRHDAFVVLAWVERCAWDPSDKALGDSPWDHVYVPSAQYRLAYALERLAEAEDLQRSCRDYGRMVDGQWESQTVASATAEVSRLRQRLEATERVSTALLAAGVPGFDKREAEWPQHLAFLEQFYALKRKA